MKRVFLAAVLAMTCAPSGVLAQERVGDAGLGALAGAIVLGPIGAVAGAVVGYTAGPSIARSWQPRRAERYPHKRSVGPPTQAATKQATSSRVFSQGASTQGAAADRAVKELSPSPDKRSMQSAGAPAPMPPVQPLE
jgi:hypothetical protein